MGIEINKPTGRFDYVAYDEHAVHDQQCFKQACTSLESMIEISIRCPRSKALALTKLEEVYMWVGKGIRNDQIARNANTKLQEERNNS